MQTLTELIPRFRSLGGREAIRQVTPYASRIVSYAELYSLVGVAISYLEDSHIQRGDRLIMHAENSPEWVALFWACLARGVHVVPIDFNFSPELRERIQSDCAARLTADAAVLEHLRQRAANTVPVEFEIAPASPDDIVEIIYTSGTTGEPHGIVHRHRNICANLEPFQLEILKYHRWATPFQPVRILELLPLSHMFGQAMGLYVPVFLEGAVAFTSEIRASSIFRLIHDNRISVAVCVPRILEVMRNETLRQSPSLQNVPAPQLRGFAGVAARWWRFREIHSRLGWKFWAFVTGGARVDPELESFWSRLGYAVVQGYGLTEASPVVAVNHPFSSRQGSLGKPVPGQEIRISADGEILVRGESVAGAVDAEGWLHTGDLGEMDSEGRLYFRGRSKDIIVTAEGLNVSPDDVERELRRIPQIKDCVVVSIGDQVHAALILRNPGSSPHEVEDWIRQTNERLEAHQRIRNWSVWPLEDFPRTTSTQKVKRSAVAERVALSPQIEREAIDPSAMSSLERVELLSTLEERYGVELDEHAFSKATTADALKQFMQNPVEARSSPPVSGWPLALPVRLLRAVFQRGFAIPLFRNRLPLTVTGLENLEGVDFPVIVAANHASDLDAPAIFAALPPDWRKRIAPAIRADYFGSSWKLRIQYLLSRSLYNAFALPQEMTGIRGILEYMGELLRRGYCPMVFPEGRRTRDGQLQSFRPGIGMMALQLHIPVVPVHIRGMFEVYSVHDSWPKTGAVHVSFGKPLKFPTGTSFEQATDVIRDAIRKLGSVPDLRADGNRT